MTRDKYPTILDEARDFLAASADPHAYRQYIAGALPDPPESPYVPRTIGVSLEVVEGGELVVEQRAAPPAAAKPTPARVPEWVQNPAKWQEMTRAERRAVERHHRRQRGR